MSSTPHEIYLNGTKLALRTPQDYHTVIDFLFSAAFYLPMMEKGSDLVLEVLGQALAGLEAVEGETLMTPIQFTPQQLADWQAYERVRKSGKFHMMSVQARQEMRLDQARYHFVQQHFEALREAAKKTEGKS